MKCIFLRPFPLPSGRARRALTLLEVLIAIFVLAVGLIALAALLPLARNYLTEGSTFDRSSTLGRHAIHDLEVRKDFLDPTNWIAPAGNGTFLQVCPPSPLGWPVGATFSPPCDTYNYAWPNSSPIQTIPAAPFIIDPLACSFPGNLFLNLQNNPPPGGGPSGVATTSASLYGPTFFPPSAYSLDGAGNPGSPALARVSIRGPNGRFLPAALADKIFRSTDDLQFETPSDPSQRPVAANGSTPSSQGDFSWFAVIDNVQRPWNPGPDGAWGVAAVDDNGDRVVDDHAEAGWPGSDDVALWQTSGGELWKVWVVVVRKRNLALTNVDAGPTAGSFVWPPATPLTGKLTFVPPERMVYCDFLTAPLPPPASSALINSAGQGGGDVEIFVPQSLPSGINPTAEWLTVRANQWVMLSAWPNLQSSLANPPVRAQLPTVAWSRVAAVDEIETTAGGWRRKLTLDGPDFNPYKFVDAVGAPAGNQSCYCTIVDGVTGVYEATVEEGQ